MGQWGRLEGECPRLAWLTPGSRPPASPWCTPLRRSPGPPSAAHLQKPGEHPCSCRKAARPLVPGPESRSETPARRASLCEDKHGHRLIPGSEGIWPQQTPPGANTCRDCSLSHLLKGWSTAATTVHSSLEPSDDNYNFLLLKKINYLLWNVYLDKSFKSSI